MTTKARRRAKAPAYDLPRQAVRDHARWLRTARLAVDESWRTNWDSPTDDSVMLVDAQAAKDRPDSAEARSWLLAESVRLCELLASAALEHVLSLEKAITARPLPHYAPMTLVRTVLEAVVEFCYLTDCTFDADSRLIRSAVVLLESALEEEKAARDLRVMALIPDALAQVKARRAAVEAWISAAGIEIHAGKRTALCWPAGRRVNLGVSITSELPKYILSVEGAYRVGSGAAHVMEWMLHDRSDEPGGVYEACGAADLSFAALSALAVHSAEYAGHDAAELGARIASYRQASGQRLMALRRSGFASAGRFSDHERLRMPGS